MSWEEIFSRRKDAKESGGPVPVVISGAPTYPVSSMEEKMQYIDDSRRRAEHIGETRLMMRIKGALGLTQQADALREEYFDRAAFGDARAAVHTLDKIKANRRMQEAVEDVFRQRAVKVREKERREWYDDPASHV